jgi:carbon-monoxide dehydrogenase small subunit
VKLSLRVNGKTHSTDIEPNRLLLDFLRDDLGLTGTKEGCGIGACGACTVTVNGRLTSSCLELAARCHDTEIVTIEGLATEHSLHPVQQAFIDHGGFQCGICTPGMVLTAVALLDDNLTPSNDEIDAAMMGSLCRCTGYYKIRDSIRAAGIALGQRGASA